MSGTHSSAANPQGPHLKLDLDTNKIGLGGAILADFLQILTAAIQMASETRVLLYIVVLLGGAAFVIWISQHHRHTAAKAKRSLSTTIGIFAGGTLIGLMLLIRPALPKIFDPPSQFWIKIIVFDDKNHDGKQNGLEQTVPGVHVVVRSIKGVEYVETGTTQSDGTVTIPLPSIGDFSVGICGTSATREVKSENDSPGSPAEMTFGLDRSHFSNCPP